MFGNSSSPQINLFKGFQQHCELIDREKYGIAMQNYAVSSLLHFATGDLEVKESKPRDDYWNMLELVVVILGAVSSRRAQFVTLVGHVCSTR